MGLLSTQLALEWTNIGLSALGMVTGLVDTIWSGGALIPYYTGLLNIATSAGGITTFFKERFQKNYHQ